jgi:hypothetical protein
MTGTESSSLNAESYIQTDIWKICHIYEGIFYKNIVVEGNILS